MGSLTDFAEGELLDHLCLTAYSPVATVYLALATADPTDAATGAAMNECANSGSYARTAITFGAAAARRVTQTGAVTFPAATGGGWGTVTHWAITDNNTWGAGNVLAHGAFAVSKLIVAGNTPSVATTEVWVEFSANEISNYAAHGCLDRMFRNQAFTISANYVALTTVVISDTLTGSTITEPGAGAYAREQVNANGGAAPDWDLAAGTTPTTVDNNDDITFTTATASWGTIVAVGICDAVTNGNLLMYDNAMADQAVTTDDTVVFAAGALDLEMS